MASGRLLGAACLLPVFDRPRRSTGRLTAPGPAGRRLTILAERLPLGQVDEVVVAAPGDVFEPRFSTAGTGGRGWFGWWFVDPAAT